MFFPPLYPAFEMFGFHLIAVYHLPLKISVNLMQVQPMSTRDIEAAFKISARSSSILRALPG